MLIEFRVSNYRSIGEEQIISLVPTPKQREYPENILTKGKYKALNVVGIYGANASGKSNVLLAMSLLDRIINLSAHSSSTTLLPYDPFLLREGWDKKPTKFEITFILNEIRYRYGMEFSEEKIISEWLYRKNMSREVELFFREEDIIEVSTGLKGNNKLIDAAIEATRPNSLFLSTCDMLNIKEAKTIFQWFKYFHMIDGLNTKAISTISIWESYGNQIKSYLARLDIGFVDIDIATKDFEVSDLPSNLTSTVKNELIKELSGKKSYEVMTAHKMYDLKGQFSGDRRFWNMGKRESKGTQKAFHLSGHIVWALNSGGVLIIDEIEAKIHPILVIDIIGTFLNSETNPNNAQLIFATHDTNLLTYSKLRRDQIYFSEKNVWESTEVFSLSDFTYLDQRERAETNKEKRYLEGRYGAIPILNHWEISKSMTDGKEG
ncbi:MAG: ATP/GTP-binding protein [Chitinophagales bacterium]